MKEAVIASAAPAPIGPYSAAIAAAPGTTVYLSGQVAIDPASQQFEGGDAAAQTRRVMANLRAVAEAAGGSLDDLVKVTIFLRDLGDFPIVNEVYASFLRPPFPARATVEVARLPKDAAVEIDGVLVIASQRP